MSRQAVSAPRFTVLKRSVKPAIGSFDIVVFDHGQCGQEQKSEPWINGVGKGSIDESCGFQRPCRQQRSRHSQAELDIVDDQVSGTVGGNVCCASSALTLVVVHEPLRWVLASLGAHARSARSGAYGVLRQLLVLVRVQRASGF